MSISSMADGAIQRKRARTVGATAVERRSPSGEGTSRTITPLKTAGELARYVPTEAIAVYIAILAGAFGPLKVPVGKKLSDLDFATRWQFFFIMLGATAALVWLVYAAKTRETPAKDPDKRYNIPVFEMTVAVVAMAAWAAALPDTPFADFDWYGGWLSPIVISTTTALLPLIATAAGKTAPVYEEAQSPDQHSNRDNDQ